MFVRQYCKCVTESIADSMNSKPHAGRSYMPTHSAITTLLQWNLS